MEYNAILVAGNTNQYNKNTVHNDYRNTTQKIIDRAVRGKSTPKVTNDMIAAQYPLIL